MGSFAELSAQLAKPHPAGFQFQHAEWLGRAVALLEGPRHGSLAAATMDAGIAAIEGQLDEKAKPAF